MMAERTPRLPDNPTEQYGRPPTPDALGRVAMVGLGHMGAPIARNLIAAGYEVSIYNRTALRAAPLAELGAVVGDTPAAAAAEASVVITSLFDDASAIETCRRSDGLVAAMKRGAVHVSTTTISPACANELQTMHGEAGQRFVAAPVIGRPPAAEAGALIALVAGAADARADAVPIIRTFASRVIEAGDEPGAACTMKLAVNFFVGAVVDLFGQVFAFADKGQVKADATRELLTTMLANPSLADYLARVAERRFTDPGFETVTGLKDMSLVLARAAELQVPLPYASVVRDHLLTAMATGRDTLDWSVMTDVSRQQAGL